MSNQIKIGIAAVVLVGMAGAAYQAQQADKQENARLTAGSGSGSLPEFKLAADDMDKITKIELKNADKGEVVLEKDGDKWRVKKPVDYPANQQNVKSLLDNLKELKAKDVIDKGTGAYADYQVDDAKAVHVVAYKGNDKVVDLYFGKSGGRGQMARKAGVDGVFAISGYSSYVYARDTKNWRETSLLKFDDAAVTKVDLKNENGEFSFAKEGDAWTAKFKGEKADKADKLERFDDNKIKDMLRAYKGLSADDFADDKPDADTGLDKPAASLTFTLKEGDPIKLSVGKTSSGESRFLRKEGDKQVYVISSWSAGWAVAKADKFQKPEEKKDDKKKDDKKDDKKKDDHDHGGEN
jgi:hypothetical protein